jgi:hypothetical protein
MGKATSVLARGSAIAVTVGMLGAGVILSEPGPRAQASQTPQSVLVPPDEETAFVCPMHPEYTSEIEGTCPHCGMTLVRAAPYDVRNFNLEFETVPAVVVPGESATLGFTISHPDTREVVRDFEVVHDQRYHLFVISQDMEYFQHLHPRELDNGTWTIDLTLPKAGYYKILSDFMPRGGSSQFLARPLVTRDFSGDLVSQSAHLVPDTVFTKTVGDLTATITSDPAVPVAADYAHLKFHLTDSATGRPVADLQTYLGAFGHTLIMSEDMVDYVHSHPVDLRAPSEEGPRPVIVPRNVDPETLRGGPDVVFEGLMPRPGRYRAWTQFRRKDVIHTFVYTFTVKAEE